MQSIFSLLVVSSIWISFIGALCPVLVCLVYDLPINPLHSLIAFLCTFAVYSRDKVSGSKEDLLNTPERAILAHYPVKQLAMLAYGLAILLAIATNWHKLPSVLVFGAAGWLYVLSVRGVRPKDIPGIKNLIVAGACTICYAGLPGAGYSLIFLIILINTILFDFRDIRGDAAAGVRTLPVLLGSSRTLFLLFLLDGILALISLPIADYGGLMLAYFRKPRPNLAYDYLVDGWILVSVVLIYLSNLERLI